MNEETSMIIKYWGVRGSIPSPLTTEQIRAKEVALIERIMMDGGTKNFVDGLISKGDVKKKDIIKNIREYLEKLPLSLSGTYGGDTTCIEIQAKDSPLIIIDAGTGAKALGGAILGRLFSGKRLNPLSSDEATKKDIHLFFTHYHWDHIQGFPFFGPGFISGDNKVNIHFHGKKDARQELSDVLKGQQRYPNFPIEWEAMPCEKKYDELGRLNSAHSIELGKAKITYQELDHPDSVFAYAIEFGGKKFVCATDTEHRDSPDPGLVNLAKDADILYYDAQYAPEEYRGEPKSLTGPVPKFRWGHSTFEWAIKNALRANVKTVVLGHHEPARDDFKIEEMGERAQRFKDEKSAVQGKLKVVMAYQGLEQKL